MSVLQRFTVEYLLNTKDELLDSNLFDIISKFMYTGVCRGVPYNIQEHITFDPNICSDFSLLEAYYPDYTWMSWHFYKSSLRSIAIGRNKNNKKYASIILESLDMCQLILARNEKDLYASIDKLLLSFREIKPLDAFDFFEQQIDFKN